MITYFVSYKCRKKSITGEGNVDVEMSSPIESIEDIRAIEKDIAKKHDFDSVVVLNYVRFEE